VGTAAAVILLRFKGSNLKCLYSHQRAGWACLCVAGANAGFSSMLFKLLWPNATVVSLEPDPSNFAMLKANTKQ
jgi:hypothetical protein